ncbi:MAG TPA: TetR family transcriptional regulator [Solirubrobacteraceae bacterium]|jgi:AcrR family transcriptional regulator|nr:TetR family transcriptional regulator [Solirubrobacteraceae bacterium]
MASTVQPQLQAPNGPSEPAGRRERKKAATRRALQEAALRLVAERGFDHVTVEDIADAADVSKRTFFNYFASKEQAVLGRDPATPESIRRALAERPAEEPPLRALEAVLTELAGQYAGSRADWVVRRQMIRSEPRLLAASVAAWTDLERILVEATSERLSLDPERDLYPALLVSASIGAVRVATLRWRTGEGGLGELVAEAFSALARGLAEPPPSPRRRHRRSSGARGS